MLVTRNLNEEFRNARRAEAMRVLSETVTAGTPYTYLAPGLANGPRIVNAPKPVRVGQGIANVGQSSMDSSYLTGVEKRAIMKYAGRIQFTEPEMMGPLCRNSGLC